MPLNKVTKPSMKLGNLYHLEYLDCCLHRQCYTHNVSVDTPFGLLQVYYIEFGNLQKTSKLTYAGRLF